MKKEVNVVNNTVEIKLSLLIKNIEVTPKTSPISVIKANKLTILASRFW